MLLKTTFQKTPTLQRQEEVEKKKSQDEFKYEANESL